MHQKIRVILREDEWQKVGRDTYNKPSDRHLSKQREGILPPLSIPADIPINLLPFQLSPGAIS